MILVKLIYSFFQDIQNIEDIFTLDEGLMHIVGILKSLFTSDEEAWKIAYTYKDKKIMRTQLVNKSVSLNY